MRTTVPDAGFPLMVRVDGEPADLLGFTREHRAWLAERVEAHGAVLLRGFAATTPDTLAQFVEVWGMRPRDYVHGNSPRTKVDSANVYTSTEHPAEFAIPMHNEMSYALHWPALLFLQCVVAPTLGGRTPLADSREILRRLSPGLRRRFTDKGLLYLQHLHGGVGLGRSWQETYETDDRAVVEDHLRAFDVDFAWTAEGGLRTRQLRHATVVHPKLGEEVWFNQADQWHWSGAGAGPEDGADLLDLLGEENLPTGCRFGDGSPIDPADLEEIRTVGQACAVGFDWVPGDVLVFDNVRLAHGREPYEGPRRVLLAMG